MIVDFIKSWLYYPKLKEYLESKGMSAMSMFGNRLGYAKWHSRCGKLKYNHYKPKEDKPDGYTNIFDKEPICNFKAKK